MDHSTPGLPVHHQLLESTQTHVDWVGDAIQPSHPLSSPSPPALSLSQHRGLFQWVSSSHQVAKVLEFQFQHHLFTLFLSSERIASWHEYSDWLLLSPAFMKAGLCYLIHWNNPWDRVSAQYIVAAKGISNSLKIKFSYTTGPMTSNTDCYKNWI